MSDFIKFRDAVNEQFNKMSTHDLFVTEMSKDAAYLKYLSSFPEGSNPIYLERREHDCNCCRQFIRASANVVAIIDNNLVSIWDINNDGLDDSYKTVAAEMSKIVKSYPIANVFLHDTATLGTKKSNQLIADKIKTWNHFYYTLPNHFVNADPGSKLSAHAGNKSVFKRSMEEITISAVDIVTELIEQNSIYRGKEHTSIISTISGHLKAYNNIQTAEEKDRYCWVMSVKLGGVSKFKNTVIGTLLVDISNGIALDQAVAMFETKVAPANYKRPSAIATKSMIRKAEQTVIDLGIGDSLQRRFAIESDVTINNVLFANRTIKKAMNVFDEMVDDVPAKPIKLDKIEDVSAETFVTDILPTVSSIELLFDNKHLNNLVSLISPMELDAVPIFKWGNNFSWAYNGAVADSIKENVKKAGGNVKGVLRFSIQWNDDGDNNNDFDAHCSEPHNNLIYFENKGRTHASSGMLDVDIVKPGTKVAVENIVWTDLRRMPAGDYAMKVHNYTHRGSFRGFAAEIEYDGQIMTYVHDKNIPNKGTVNVATVNLSKSGKLSIKESLKSTNQHTTEWGITTNNFQKVSMVMNSPNHWDGNNIGNKHLFFIIDKCVQPGKVRGFFNEFLTPELNEHRKVFEVLGSKMLTPESDKQLSGLGFSSTRHDSVIVKVTGSFTRTIKINF